MAIVIPATRTIAPATCPATGNPSPKARSALPDEREAGAKPEPMEVMSMSVNKVIVVGNLGADPVVRALPNGGQNVANFSIASTERFTDRSGNQQARTEWFRVVAFGKLADTCERFLSKGRQVYVEGKRTRTEVIARQIRFLGSRNNAAEIAATDADIPF
jgi:single-strand DNA-binding protein